MEEPRSKILNLPLVERSCLGLNNKLGVSTHVTLPVPPLHHCRAVRWGNGSTLKQAVFQRRKYRYEWETSN